MKWWLIFQVASFWSSQPLQIQGPFDTKDICDQVKEQFDTFKITSKCISVQQTPPASK